MEDINILRKFIDNSDLTAEVKKALFDCLMLELRKSPTSEYLRVIKQNLQVGNHEN